MSAITSRADAAAAGGAASMELAYGRETIARQSAALDRLAQRLDESFLAAVARIDACRGSVIVTGVGKAGLIGQKLAATLASLAIPAHFVHPVEAIHGDLGRIAEHDLAVVLSFSGESEEITRLIDPLIERAVPIVAITGRAESTLARAAAVTVCIGPLEEACPHNLAPTTSTTAMLALGDAVALTVARRRRFEPADFARNHPGGSLGVRLAKVEDLMRPLAECRLAPDTATVREVMVGVARAGRRSGAVMLTAADGTLSGVFTDSDLARLFETRRDDALDGPICAVMTRSPIHVAAGSPMPEALQLFASRKISELPVLDGKGRPLGMLDVTDILAWLPEASRRRLLEDRAATPATLRLIPPEEETKQAERKDRRSA